MPFPGGEYILAFRHSGLSNFDKVTGILPRAQLAPTATAGCTLPFFACASEDDLTTRCETVAALNGTVTIPPTPIMDGVFAAITDPVGTPAMLYWRSDEPDGVREYEWDE